MQFTKVELEIPDTCDKCDGESMNIWGTKIQGRINVKISCARCGKALFKIALVP